MIYLDNNATTRPSAGVTAEVRRAVETLWANPSSVHRAGQEVRAAVELARQDVARLIGAKPRDVVFTGSGTESIDLAIRGVLAAAPEGRRAVVSARTEHAAVRDLLEALEKEGAAEIRWARVGPGGIADAGSIRELLDDSVALVTVMWANNETGAVQPVREIGRICREAGVVFHSDGTQWVGKEPAWDAESEAAGQENGGSAPGHSLADPLSRPGAGSLPCDLLSFSPHKFHGPKGVGVLWARRGVRLRPQVHGAQELGRRGGTENVPGILGAGAAAREAAAWLAGAGDRERLAGLRDRFEAGVLARVRGAVVNGPAEPGSRIWNTANIGFPRLEAEALLLLLSERGVCASAGAACSSGSLDPSPVLLAMGVPPEVAHGSLRFSLSKETTRAEIDGAVDAVVAAVERLSESSAGMG